MAATIFTLSSLVFLHVSLSKKYRAPQIELKRGKQDGKEKKIYLNQSVMKMMLAKGQEVLSLMKKMKKDASKNDEVPVPAIDLTLDDKKGLTISCFGGQPFVQIEVFKDNVRQNGLGKYFCCNYIHVCKKQNKNITPILHFQF